MIKCCDVSEERTVAVVKVPEQFQVDSAVLRWQKVCGTREYVGGADSQVACSIYWKPFGHPEDGGRIFLRNGETCNNYTV
jgi:hypothetical protein